MWRYSAVATLSFLLSIYTPPVIAEYSLQDDYTASNFFDMFDFFTAADPTNGYVQYVSQATAQSAGYISSSGGSVYMGVDSVNIASGSGRQSVRLTSTASYNHGLIILDLAHMPGGICGTWPAFWTVGPSWPAGGEIDIIEGVNSQAGNDMTLHTSAGCSMSSSSTSNSGGLLFSGSATTTNCDVNAAGQAENAGCQISDASVPNSFGTGFNAGGGGVYATEWTSDFIRIFLFPAGSAPADINSANPNPDGWGTPAAYFGNSACDIDSHFQNNQIVFDTTFCGDWAGNVWSSDATCSSQASTCQEFVQNNPTAFKNAYWSVNSLKVYTDNGAPATASAAPSAAASAAPSVITMSALTWPTNSGLPSTIPAGSATASSPVQSQTSAPWWNGNRHPWSGHRLAKSVPPTQVTTYDESVATPAAIARSGRNESEEKDEHQASKRRMHRHLGRHLQKVT